MLDQNTAIILSALLGGLLTITGGVLANYYVQSASERTAKRKEVRNLLEKIYKELIEIDLKVYQVFKNIETDKDNETLVVDIVHHMENISLIVNLYLPPLKNDFTEYNEVLKEAVYPLRKIENYAVYKTKPREEKNEKTIFAKNKFMASIKTLLKQEGYSYF